MLQQYVSWLKDVLKKPDKYAVLRKFSIFKELSSFQLYLLNNFLHTRTFKAGEMLFDADYPLEVVYFIVSGEIEVIGKTHPSGRSVLKKNQFLGMIDMFHENIRSSRAFAITNVTVLAISRFDLMDVIDKNPRMGVKILKAVCQSFSNYIFTIANPPESKQG